MMMFPKQKENRVQKLFSGAVVVVEGVEVGVDCQHDSVSE